MSARDDARFDAHIHDAILRDTGVVEDDEPTAYSHWAWTEAYLKSARGEFTWQEREQIRAHLGLGPFGGQR